MVRSPHFLSLTPWSHLASPKASIRRQRVKLGHPPNPQRAPLVLCVTTGPAVVPSSGEDSNTYLLIPKTTTGIFLLYTVLCFFLIFIFWELPLVALLDFSSSILCPKLHPSDLFKTHFQSKVNVSFWDAENLFPK